MSMRTDLTAEVVVIPQDLGAIEVISRLEPRHERLGLVFHVELFDQESLLLALAPEVGALLRLTLNTEAIQSKRCLPTLEEVRAVVAE